MSIQTVRRSLLGAAAGVAILVGGVWTGRLAAGPLGHGRHFDAERIFGRIADRLDLSESQRDQVKDVLRTRRDAIIAEVQAVRTARLALRQAIEAQPLDEAAVRARAADLGKAEADAAVLHAEIRGQVLPILNDEQKEKLAALRRHAETADRTVSSIRDFLSK